MSLSGHCRLCAGACGVQATTDGAVPTALRPDPADPVSQGQPCAVLDHSLAARTGPGRIRQPLRRAGEALVPCSWDEALAGIGAALGGLRSASGPGALGLYLGPTLAHRSAAMARSLALGVSLGTPHIFSAPASASAPLTRAAELALGHVAWLLPDVGRAHYVLLFGDHDDTSAWGPALRGRVHLSELRHSLKTKGTKLVAVGPRRSALADEATQHVAIRPGTEGIFLLGMLVAAVRGGWGDQQYLRDYTRDAEALEGALAGWTVDRCAAICGVEAAVLSGVALKFSRAAMAVAVPGPATFHGLHGGVAAWAWLALHTLTANTLRPGGLYDHEPLIDLQPLAAAVPTALAPESNRGLPLHLLQLPAEALGPSLEGDEDQRVRGLIVVDGDPAATLPGGPRLRAALDQLDTLVVLACHESATTAKADWVLPVAHPWEESELEILSQPVLPRQILRHSAALAAPEGEARPAAEVLAQLHAAVHPGLRGGAFGLHLSLLARGLSGAALETWAQRLVGFGVDGVPDDGLAPGAALDQGVSNRALWRVGHDHGRIALLPDELRALLSALTVPADDPARPLRLWTTRSLDRAPDAAHRPPGPRPELLLHPDCGHEEGALVRVETAHGAVVATVSHDARLRPDVVCLPVGTAVDAMALLPMDAQDPLLGTVQRDGLAAALRPA